MEKNKRYTDAEYYYKKAVQNDPKFHFAYYNLGILYETINKNDESVKHYKKALEINPEYVNAMINLGLLYETK